MSFSDMQARTAVQGNSERAAIKSDAAGLAGTEMKRDPSYRDEMYLWEHGTEPEFYAPLPIRIFNERFSENEGDCVDFECLCSSNVRTGDVIYDGTGGIYRLVTKCFDVDGIITAGTAVQCQVMIKWQDKSGEIFTYPAYDRNATQYNMGVSETMLITLGASKHLLYLPADPAVIALDHGDRLFLDRNENAPTAFEVTQNDSTSMNYGKGIVKLTVSENELDLENDSIPEWLCGVKEKSPFEIIFSGGTEFVPGDVKIFGTNARQADFALQADEDILPFITLSLLGKNMCAVTVALSHKVRGRSFSLTAVSGEERAVLGLTII